ncbi:hypothetical protein [Micromonospora sp. NPDC003241]
MATLRRGETSGNPSPKPDGDVSLRAVVLVLVAGLIGIVVYKHPHVATPILVAMAVLTALGWFVKRE